MLCPRVSHNPTRWSRGTKTLGTRLELYFKDTPENEFLSDKKKSLKLGSAWWKHVILVLNFFGPMQLPTQIVSWHILII